MPYSYTHLTSSPLYTNPTHTIERLSRSSWQITSPLLSSPIPAKTYAEAKQKAAGIDFDALSVKAAEVEPVATVEVVTKAPAEAMVNPFEAILAEAAQITDLGDMQGAYDQAVRECDLCAVLGHISGQSLGDVFRGRFRLAVEAARAKVPDYARVVDLAGLLTGEDSMLWARVACDAKHLADGAILPLSLIESLCDLPDTAGYIRRALMLWACAVGLDGEASWVARLRLEGAALRHAREVAGKGRDAQEVRMVEDGGRADMGRDSADLWGCVWSWACDEDLSEYLRADRVGELLPSLLSPEPEHWLPISADGRVLVINWRAGESTGEVISASVWLDDGGLSLLGSYVLGSGWVSDDRLREEDVDSEALGVILEAINARGLAVIA